MIDRDRELCTKAPWRRPTPRARRPLARLLQFHPAAQGVAVRSRDPDASDASRLGDRANELERHLHGAGRSLRIPCSGRTRSRCRPAHAHEPSRAVIVLVAARTQIGCLINSEWRKHRIVCSMSRRSNCHDNAVMESFFSTVKSELADRFDTYGDAKMELFDSIEVFYNQRRRHSTLGQISPAAFERRANEEGVEPMENRQGRGFP